MTDSFSIYLRILNLKVLALGSLFTYGSCVLFQPITEPTERILRRGSCIGFDVPPITLTPQQTAAERQLLGEEVQIEPNGWMTASSQSTAHISHGSKTNGSKTKDQSPSGSRREIDILRRYSIERGILKYYEKILSDYRSNQILGESFDGKVRLVPYRISGRGNQEERKLVKKMIFEVNRARIWLYEYHLKKAKKQGQIEEVRKRYLTSYFRKAKEHPYEWVYTADKKWLRTP